MADHHGRDIEGDILRVLAEADGPLPAKDVRMKLVGQHPAGGPPSDTTVRRWLDRLHRSGAVRERQEGGRWRYSLTDEGRRVAEARGHGRTET